MGVGFCTRQMMPYYEGDWRANCCQHSADTCNGYAITSAERHNKMATSPDQAALLLGVQNRHSLNGLFGDHKGKPQLAISNPHHRRVVNCGGRGGYILIFPPIEQALAPHI